MGTGKISWSSSRQHVCANAHVLLFVSISDDWLETMDDGCFVCFLRSVESCLWNLVSARTMNDDNCILDDSVK
jgi:hypothetical protein